jgi:nitrate reductase gamma subunit
VRQTEPPPAGYYPDPQNPAVERWWDGTAWAESPEMPAVNVAPVVEEPVGPPRNNQFAMASLVLSISWVFFVGSILGVIFGHLAMQQIRESEGREVGRGNAMVGLIVGYAGVACGLLALLILLG